MPLFYAETAHGLVFGNSLGALRSHPDVSDRLNEQAIGDFLLFNLNLDSAATTFAAIRQLPPAHSFTWQDGRLALRRFRSEPAWEGFLDYPRQEDYAEPFLAVFRQAVEDRLGSGSVATQLSGGLDSTSIASIAQERLRSAGLRPVCGPTRSRSTA